MISLIKVVEVVADLVLQLGAGGNRHVTWWRDPYRHPYQVKLSGLMRAFHATA